MKWLITPVLWLLAVMIALGVLWRLWRGKPVVLHGRLTPRVIRMVAVVLVALGLGSDRSDAAPVPAGDSKGKVDEELPPGVTVDSLTKWLYHHQYPGRWISFKKQYTKHALEGGKLTAGQVAYNISFADHLPERLKAVFLADLRAMAGEAPAPALTAREMLAVIDEAERNGLFDPWLVAHLWRKTAAMSDSAERREAVTVMARLHRLARLADSMTLVKARLLPLMVPPRAWASKAGRPLGIQQIGAPGLIQGIPGGQDLAPVLKQLRSVYAKTGADTWTRQAVVTLSVVKGSAAVTMIRGGSGEMPMTEGMLQFGRFDLLETTAGDRPVILQHPLAGRIEVPAGKLVSVWDLSSYLPEPVKERVKKLVADALSGNASAARQLEGALPLAHGFIRDGLRGSPGAAGASLLRLVLTQFDDLPKTARAEDSPVVIPEDRLPRGRR